MADTNPRGPADPVEHGAPRDRHDHHERIDVLGSLSRERDVALGRVGADGAAAPEGASGTVRPARAEDATAIGRIQAQTLAVTMAAGLETEVAGLPEPVRGALDPATLAEGWRASIAQPPSARHHTLVALDEGRVVGFAAVVPADQPLQATQAGPVDARDAADAAELPPQDPRPAGPAGTGPEATAREVLAERTEAGATLGAPQPTAEELEADRREREERAQRTPVVAEIIALEVPAESGRRGHGSRLAAACVDLAREEGATHVQTWAVQGEESRARFLDACGFAPAGLRRASPIGEKRLVELAWYAQV